MHALETLLTSEGWPGDKIIFLNIYLPDDVFIRTVILRPWPDYRKSSLIDLHARLLFRLSGLARVTKLDHSDQ